MKKLSTLLVITIIAMYSTSAIAADLSADQVRNGIVGEWRLLSFEPKGKMKVDYSKDEVKWRFTADGTAFISDKQLGEFTDTYKVVKSKYGWIGKGGILILIKELKNRGFSHLPKSLRSFTVARPPISPFQVRFGIFPFLSKSKEGAGFSGKRFVFEVYLLRKLDAPFTNIRTVESRSL